MLKLAGLLLLLLLNAKLPAFGQQNSDGSLYSRFGIGELFNYSSSQIQGMGGGGVALTSLNYVNLINPASLSDQSLTRLGASVQFQGLEIANDQDNASRLNSSMLQAFQFSFPIRRGNLGVAISYNPYTRIAHKVQQEPIPISTTLQDPASYVITFQGEGGLQKATAGIGWRPFRYASFGITADFIFGILEENRRTEVFATETTSNLFFNSTELTSSTRMSGFTSTLGTLVAIPNVLSSGDALSLGMSVSLPTTLEATRTRTIGQSLDQDTLGVALKGDIELPVRTNFGLSYHPNTQWTFIADLTYEPWRNFDSELDLPGFIPNMSSSFEDRTRFSVGVDFMPSSNVLDSYFRRVGYRLGYYFDSGYINLADNIDLNTFAFTAGLSLPTLFPGTRIDVNLEAGKRGTTNLNFVRESFYKIHVSVNIGERWFERRKLG